MKLELTEDQQHQLDEAKEKPIAVRDPRSRAEYVLIPIEEYEHMKEIVQDDVEQRALRRAAARNLANRLAADEGQ